MSDFFDYLFLNPIVVTYLVIIFQQNGITTQIQQQIYQKNVIDDIGCTAIMAIYVESNYNDVTVALNGQFPNDFNCTVDADTVNTTVVLFNGSDMFSVYKT